MDDLSAGHHIGVHIGRVGRFNHEGGAVPVKQVQNISQFVAGAAGYKYFIRRKADAPFSIISGNRFPQKRRAGM